MWPIVIDPSHTPDLAGASPYLIIFTACVRVLDLETESGARQVLAAVRDTGASDADRKRLATSKHIVVGDRSLNARGFLNDIDTLKSQADADAIESSIGTVEARLIELAFERLQDQTRRRKDQLRRKLGMSKVETDLALVNERLVRDSRVISPYAGRVVDLMLTPHALIEKGAPAALLQPQRPIHSPMEAIVFVPAGLGKKIQLGADVEVSPDTVRRQEHGFVRGKVLAISEIPATEMAMLAELEIDRLSERRVLRDIKELLGQCAAGQTIGHHDLRAVIARTGRPRPDFGRILFRNGWVRGVVPARNRNSGRSN